MTDQLIALLDGNEVGAVHYKDSRLSFTYSETWRNDSDAYPLSLSMPLGNPRARPDRAITRLALDEGGSATYLFDRFEEAGRLALSALNLSSDVAGIAVAIAIAGRSVPATEILPNHCDLHLLPWKGSTVEEVISTRGIMRLHEERKGSYRSVKEIAANCSVDGIANDTMSVFGKELGLVIETYLLAFAPNAIILGGSISRSTSTFLPAALSVAPALSGILKVSSHFERSAVIGSIAHWLHLRG